MASWTILEDSWETAWRSCEAVQRMELFPVSVVLFGMGYPIDKGEYMRYIVPHNGARLLFRFKHVYADNAILEIKVWSVLITERTPEGLKYSMAYIDSDKKRMLGYDNAEGKGHHRHQGAMETSVEFKSWENLTRRFLQEVSQMRRSVP